MRHILLLSITFILTCASVEAQGPVQNPANHHWYQAVDPIPGGWVAAKAQAESMTFQGMTGHLATVTSSDESNFISANLPAACTGAFWLGGFQDRSAPDYSEPAGGWRWITGEAWNLTFWSAGEPNNQFGIEDYLLFRGFADCTWNDGRTNDFAPRGLLVEFESPCQMDPSSVTPLISNNNKSMNATFRPIIQGTPMSLLDAQHACGFSGFDWVQLATQLPGTSALYTKNPPTNPGSGMPVILVPPQPPVHDPPPGGWSYPLSQQPPFLDAFPFFYNPSSIPSGCAGHFPDGTCAIRIMPDPFTLKFYDMPFSTCLPGGRNANDPRCLGTPTEPFMAYTTQLVGICDALLSSCNFSGPSDPLYQWTWKTNYNGDAASPTGIFDFVATASSYPPDTGSGTGGITITSINGIPQTPPSISCAAIPNTLWPPNNKEVSVGISGIVTAGTQALVLESVAFVVSDTEAQIQPSGAVAMGSDGTYSFTVPLFASRDGNNRNGRQYTIAVSASDQIGNVGSCSTVVTVPHDQGH